jgi:uncharacterized SAM-binding protein YcdF (DUF218 family)
VLLLGLGTVAVLLAGEIALFVLVLSDSRQDVDADVVVVFTGGGERVRDGYRALADQKEASLLISVATPESASRFDNQFAPGERVVHLYETEARTTFENAVYTAAIVRRQDLDSVLLVTSLWHMPRAYLLMRLQLAGSGVAVYRHASGVPEQDDRIPWHSQAFRRHLYRESIELWGSLAEQLYHLITGSLPIQNPRQVRIVRKIKRWLF